MYQNIGLGAAETLKIVVYRKDFFGFCRYGIEFQKVVCVSVNIDYR